MRLFSNRSRFLRLLSSLLLLASAAACCPLIKNNRATGYLGPPKDAPRFVPGEFIVKYKPGVAAPTRRLSLQSGTLQSVRKLPDGSFLYRWKQVDGLKSSASADSTLEALRQLQEQPEVEYAHPNWLLYPMEIKPNDPYYRYQWHYRRQGVAPGESPGGIGLPATWGAGAGKEDVIVAVLDTGLVYGACDISRRNLVPGADLIADVRNAVDGDGRDRDPSDPGDFWSSWHGTHVAGTLGALGTSNRCGGASVGWKKVKIQPVRVLGYYGGSIVDITDGIRWAAGLPVEGMEQNPQRVRVISMSLGGGHECSPLMQQAIDEATARGVLVVAAASNDSSDAMNYEPAGCRNVLTVAASDATGRLAPYSNFGAAVEIMAPGGNTAVDTDNDGHPDGVLSSTRSGFAFYQGTSMAAPHVAGVAALMLSLRPELTPAQVTEELMRRAIPRDATQCPKPCGAGLLNAEAALPQTP